MPSAGTFTFDNKQERKAWQLPAIAVCMLCKDEMSWGHLLWIVPVSFAFGVAFACLLVRGAKVDEQIGVNNLQEKPNVSVQEDENAV